ncbi:MAG: F0F1 ATP synthase subunit B [Lentisphaerae bacterium]|nr:F0F1 ATP synthase subunit B [Lentisphaerota bacterium]
MQPFDLEPGLIVWTVLTFLALFALLARFAFRPLRALLEKREQTIRDSLDAAERARRQAEEILMRNREHLDKARDETRKIVNEGHRIVADMKKEAERSAREEAAHLIEQARSEIDGEVRRSLDDLKSTVANLSVRIARQVIRGELDEDKHAALAEDVVERLKKTRRASPP